MSDPHLSFAQVAARYGVVICPGPKRGVDCGSRADDHRRGFVRHGDPRVHWDPLSADAKDRKTVDVPRKMTKASLYKFLKLCYRALNPTYWTMPRWQQVYEESRAAVAAALELGVRVGRRATELDRSKVRFWLSDPAIRDTPLKEQAWRWSEKRYD